MKLPVHLQLRHPRVGIAAAIVLLFIAAAFTFGPRLQRHYIPAEWRRCLTKTDARDRERCAQERLGSVAKTGRVTRELQIMVEMQQSGWLNDCHMVAHRLGLLAHRQNRNAMRDPAARMRVCRDGFVHGVAIDAVPTLMKEGVAFPASIETLCPGKSTGSGDLFCPHAAGHGALAVTRDDLPQALSLCGTLRTALERSRCAGGAVMQNGLKLFTVNLAGHKLNEEGVCADLAARGGSMLDCVQNIGENAVLFHDAPARAVELCGMFETTEARDACMRGVARASSIRNRRSRHWHHGKRIPFYPDPPPIAATLPHRH